MAKWWLTAWGLAAVAFGGASLIVPLYVVELGGDAFTLGVLFASASFVGVPGALVFGNLADRTGRRRVFALAAMGVTAATMAAIPLFDAIAPVVAANALLWLGFAAATPVLTLLVVADEPEDRWSAAIARLNTYQGVGWALGLAAGFVVIAVGSRLTSVLAAQRAFFVSCAVAAAVAFALGARTLPPDPERAPTPRRLSRFVRAAGRFNVRGAAFPFTPGRVDVRGLDPRRFRERFTPQLAVYFLAVFLFSAGFGTFFAPLPAYLSVVGYGPDAIFGLYLLLNVGAAETSTGGSGSSGGGGGVSAPSDPTASVTSGEATSITDADPAAPGTTVSVGQTSVESITFEDDDVTGTASVSELADVPGDAPTLAPDRAVAAVFEIEVPDSQTDRSATLEFELTTDEVSDAGLDPDEIAVLRGVESEYQELDTDVTVADDTVTVVADTPGFSTFLVSSSESEPATPDQETETPEPETETPESDAETPESETETPEPEPEEQAGFGAVVALVALLAAVLITRRTR